MKQNTEQLKKIIQVVKDCLAIRNGEIVGYEDLTYELETLLPHLISSDEIKREAKEEIKRQLEMTILLADQNIQNGNYVDWVALLNSFIKHNLTQSKEGGE